MILHGTLGFLEMSFGLIADLTWKSIKGEKITRKDMVIDMFTGWGVGKAIGKIFVNEPITPDLSGE